MDKCVRTHAAVPLNEETYEWYDLERALDLFSGAAFGMEFPEGSRTWDVNSGEMGPMRRGLTRDLSTGGRP